MACAACRTSASKIHKLKHIKLHAKLLLADDKRAIIGSINLAPGSFDSRRELAIEVDDEHIISRIRETLQQRLGELPSSGSLRQSASLRTRGRRSSCERRSRNQYRQAQVVPAVLLRGCTCEDHRIVIFVGDLPVLQQRHDSDHWRAAG